MLSFPPSFHKRLQCKAESDVSQKKSVLRTQRMEVQLLTAGKLRKEFTGEVAFELEDG